MDPRTLLTQDETYDRDNHELRIASAQDKRFRWLLGAFYENDRHAFDWEWHVLGLDGLATAGTPSRGGAAGHLLDHGPSAQE